MLLAFVWTVVILFWFCVIIHIWSICSGKRDHQDITYVALASLIEIAIAVWGTVILCIV